jgi:hypothetical protein
MSNPRATPDLKIEIVPYSNLKKSQIFIMELVDKKHG